MPANCQICVHPQKDEIDRALITSGAIHGALRRISGNFSVSEDALARHRNKHLPAALVKASQAEAVVQGDSLLAKVQSLEADARRIAGKAETGGDLKTAISGIRELIRIVELLAKLQGQLAQEGTTQVNIQLDIEWISLRTLILNVLDGFPQAKVALVHALQDKRA